MIMPLGILHDLLRFKLYIFQYSHNCVCAHICIDLYYADFPLNNKLLLRNWCFPTETYNIFLCVKLEENEQDSWPHLVSI